MRSRQAFLKYPNSNSIPDWEVIFLDFGSFFNNASVHIYIFLCSVTPEILAPLLHACAGRAEHITFFLRMEHITFLKEALFVH